MSKKQIIILVILAILIIGGAVGYVFWLKPILVSRTEIPQPSPTPEDISEILTSGTIGETKPSDKTKLSAEGFVSELPDVIFNTAGVITEVKPDRLIVQGDGSNFNDRKPRELILIFTDSTITFEPGQKIKYQGLAGLKYLKTGGAISISSPENIRGKTQFTVDYINKL